MDELTAKTIGHILGYSINSLLLLGFIMFIIRAICKIENEKFIQIEKIATWVGISAYLAVYLTYQILILLENYHII